MVCLRLPTLVYIILCVVVAPFGLMGQATAPTYAPAFSLTTLDGHPLNFADYKGAVVLLDFWATWCVPCQTEIPHFVSLQKKYGDRGFHVIGISMDDSPEPVRQFYAKYKMNYPVALGNEDVAKKYGGVLGLPITYLIARDGTIVRRYDSIADLTKIANDVTALMQSSSK